MQQSSHEFELSTIGLEANYYKNTKIYKNQSFSKIFISIQGLKIAIQELWEVIPEVKNIKEWTFPTKIICLVQNPKTNRNMEKQLEKTYENIDVDRRRPSGQTPPDHPW